MTHPATTDTERELTREDRFIGRLAAAHYSRTIGSLMHWHPGQIDTRVIAITQDASEEEYTPWALAAKAFALFHAGRRDARYGHAGTGIGGWARRVDADPVAVERLITALTRAQAPLDLDRALTVLARMSPRSPRFCPHWQTVLAELTGWADPTRRDHVRFTWARDYYTYTPPSSTPTQDN